MQRTMQPKAGTAHFLRAGCTTSGPILTFASPSQVANVKSTPLEQTAEETHERRSQSPDIAGGEAGRKTRSRAFPHGGGDHPASPRWRGLVAGALDIARRC